jgi:hypothetical protein
MMSPTAITMIGHESSIENQPASETRSQAAAVMKTRPSLGSPGGDWTNLARPMPPRMTGHSDHIPLQWMTPERSSAIHSPTITSMAPMTRLPLRGCGSISVITLSVRGG